MALIDRLSTRRRRASPGTKEPVLICIVTTWSHDTHRKLLDFPGLPEVRLWTYDKLFRSRSLPAATWIFTDMDRLGFWELELAARAHRMLRSHGMRTLNDPAKTAHRFDLLKRLHASGLNRFNVWRPGDAAAVDKWPVFLRTESAHRGPLTGLIENAGELGRELDKAIDAGHPERDLMIVEYCAEPVREGLFRKHAVFRVGDRMVTTLAVHDTSWLAKRGQQGVAGKELYLEELENLDQNPHAGKLRQAFEIGNIEYGRADYAMVAGEPQVYEINTNPSIGRVLSHPDPSRIQSSRIWERNFVEALAAIDSPGGAPARLDERILAKQRRRDLWMTRSRWVI